ncbi:MAG: NAD-dependent malic enzyme, partial [Gemmatimonadetes bacterium]|nr:NAD-dependent malic enzyme [Gemmatimonadota bacterium]
RSECTAKQAYIWTDGRAIFASGSPFDPVDLGGRIIVSGQANNAYIFPGLGLGVIASRARRITGDMFAAAAECLASEVSEETLATGSIYPPLDQLRDVSANIAVVVAEIAFRAGLAEADRPEDLNSYVRSIMYEPNYPDFV